MAWTKHDTPEEKKALQKRALALKPRVHGVVATELGWAIPQSNGTLEILVRYHGLDALLGDEISEVEVVGEPITIEPEVVTEEVALEEEVKEEPKEEIKMEAPVKKKPGPKAKAVQNEDSK